MRAGKYSANAGLTSHFCHQLVLTSLLLPVNLAAKSDKGWGTMVAFDWPLNGVCIGSVVYMHVLLLLACMQLGCHYSVCHMFCHGISRMLLCAGTRRVGASVLCNHPHFASLHNLFCCLSWQLYLSAVCACTAAHAALVAVGDGARAVQSKTSTSECFELAVPAVATFEFARRMLPQQSTSHWKMPLAQGAQCREMSVVDQLSQVIISKFYNKSGGD